MWTASLFMPAFVFGSSSDLFSGTIQGGEAVLLSLLASTVGIGLLGVVPNMFVLFGTIALLIVRKGSVALLVCGVIALGCAIASGVLLENGDDGHLLIGYWVWLGSMVTLTAVAGFDKAAARRAT